MGTLLSTPATYVANTRAKAAEMNAKLSDLNGVLTDGSRDVYINGLRQRRSLSVSQTLTGSECWTFGAPILAAGVTLDIATSTGVLVCLDTCELATTATVHIASGATWLII